MSEQSMTGVCTEVAQKPGSDWVEFHVDGGGKYPVRLSTKLLPLIELAKAVGGNLATWTYKEVESDKINEKSGKPYVNRYLEGVEIGGQNPASSVATPVAAARVYAPDLKDRMIVRQTALKAAAEIVGPRAAASVHPDFDAALEVMRAAQRFESWVYRDIDPLPSDAGPPPLSEHDDGIPY